MYKALWYNYTVKGNNQALQSCSTKYTIPQTNYMGSLSQLVTSNCTWMVLETVEEIGIKNCPDIPALIISNRLVGIYQLRTRITKQLLTTIIGNVFALKLH